MQNFTKEESSALLYLKLARDLGANNVNFDKSTYCPVPNDEGVCRYEERTPKERGAKDDIY